MAFTMAQKVDIRRYMGFSAYGGSQSAGEQEWRFLEVYGLLEFRMNNLDSTEETVILGYLTNLNALEAALPASSGNLDTASASVYVHNPNEVRDRMRLYTLYRREFCAFLGMPPGPGIRSSNSISLSI
jgi:hypothetical protein